MAKTKLLDEIAAKGSDKEAIAARVASSPRAIESLLDGMRAKAAAVKFGCGKVLMLLSAKCPENVYPYFERIAEFLESDNKILKWGAIATLSNLAHVDFDGGFAACFERFFGAIDGPDMVAACNVIKGAPAVARAHPALADRIVERILAVRKAVYKTPECRNVATGQALDALAELYDSIGDKAPVIRFVKAQLRNPRKKVARTAAQFLERVRGAAPASRRRAQPRARPHK